MLLEGKMKDDNRETAQAERIAKLTEALEEIAGNENDPCMGRECRDTPRLRRREWCPSCIARAALAPKGEERG